MLRVLIAGAGNFGREIAGWLDGCHGAGCEWELAGFLSDDPAALDGYCQREPILGTINDYEPLPDDRLIVAMGNPEPKLAVAEKLRQRGARFLQVIHKSAVVSRHVTLGEGVIIAPHSFIGCDAILGDFVVLNVSSTVGHDARLGDGCTLSGHCDVTGHVRLGKGVFFGTHACTVPEVTIGDGAYIGAGSVVIRNVAQGARMFGVPAKKMIEIKSTR